MNRQRKVLITITYNEMGIIIDTKAEEVTQPDLQPTCNQLATDCISRQALCEYALNQKDKSVTPNDIMRFPSAQPERTGHWISDTGKPVKMYNGCPVSACYCSECGDWLGASDEYDITGRYCPNCGARMES